MFAALSSGLAGVANHGPVREGGQPLGERELAGIFGVLLQADDALAAVIEDLPDPPRD